jgi:phage terminase large subunit
VSFWRKEDPVIENGIVIKGGMWSYQREWIDSPSFMPIMIGGYGSGKTAISAKDAIQLAIYNAPAPHLCVSPSYKMAKRTILPHLKNMLDGRRIRYKYNKSDFEFTLSYGGRTGTIWVGSGDNPDALKGPNLGSANMDEPFMQRYEVFQQVEARLRYPGTKRRRLSMTGTPEELNWGYDICEGEEHHKYQDRMQIVRARTAENLALPPDYVEGLLKSYDPLMAQAYLNGEFVQLDGNLTYHSFTDNNIIETNYDPNLPLLVGMDFNVDPMSATIFQQKGGEHHQIDEIILKNSNTESMCKEILSQYPGQVFTVYPDASGNSRSSKGTTDFIIIKDIFAHQLDKLSWPSKNPSLKDRFNCVNAALCNSKGVRQYFISDRCKETIQDYKRITHPYDDYKKKNSKRTHASDAAGYLIHRRLPLASKPTLSVR